MAMYAAFIEESRMKFANPTKLDRKSGVSGSAVGNVVRASFVRRQTHRVARLSALQTRLRSAK